MMVLPQIAFGQPEKAASPNANQYIIGSGDILEIITWKEADFTRNDVLVRLDGKITLPLLNDVQAAGKTPMELKKILEKILKDFVASPVVTIIVKSAGSQKFYILGEVMNTGEYPIMKELTVLQAFALAGGFTQWASKKEIILLRYEGNEEKRIRIDYKRIIRGKDLDSNMKIKANDTIIVP
ncbi:MAG: polysaccharide export protein [Proteobacteria bacterium]|nr:polysaccharide export protein [Pseudomonadota bacterium]